MEIIVWLAVGIFVLAGEVQTAASDPFKTEAECRTEVARVDAVARTHDDLLAFAQQCVQMTVKENVVKPTPKISKPKPNALGDTGERTLNVAPK